MARRIEALLARPSAPLWLGAFAVCICLPALTFGLQADDHLFAWKLENGSPRWSLFAIDASDVPAARERGFVVWWSSPKLSVQFLRPIASLSHALDFSLWPHAAWWMHLINALLYGACVSLAALSYRRLAPSAAVASLASLMFAIDDGHAFSAGWISGRNTLFAALFSLLALWLHVLACNPSRASLRGASALSAGLALLSAEAGVWSIALLVSHAIAFETGPFAARLRSVAPQLGVAVLWACAYLSLDCGVDGSSFYRDPSSPLFALTQGMLDLPVWFWAMFGPGDFALSVLQPALWVRAGCLLASLPLLWLLWPAIRSSAASRFFALAFLLSLAPLLCTQPSARALIGASFGGLGWVASSVVAARAQTGARARWTQRIFWALHIACAALTFLPALGSIRAFANGTARIVDQVEPGRDVVLVQAPFELLSNYVLLSTDLRTRTGAAPRSLHHLYTGASALWVERVDARTLDVEVDRGWGYVPIERVFCTAEDMPRSGAEVRLSAFTARVLRSTAQGMPARVRFTFPSALEANGRQWLTWEDNRVVPFRPPALGKRVRLAPRSFFAALR